MQDSLLSYNLNVQPGDSRTGNYVDVVSMSAKFTNIINSEIIIMKLASIIETNYIQFC